MVKIKRVYEPSAPSDGVRILVDRLWPRGVKKTEGRIDEWRRELAPTSALRKWFQHDPRKWDEFRRRYRNELKAKGKRDELQELAERARSQTITLLFGARDPQHNNAVALKDLLKELSG